MRLHRLRVEAFGPFAAPVEVDFDALTDAGLFLLHGATGAGKTSLLDAVCFALYGQVPGARAAGRPRLRSDHAADGLAPQVVLELTVAGRRLEVTRSPEWWRPKKRGVGTTREPARTDVRELVDGTWQVVVGRRSDEAGLLLRDLLGMGLEQFTKVVLLPQGEFAAFLRAGAEQRAELLGRLFDIDRYTGVENWLREERQALARELAAVDTARDALVARAHEVSRLIAGSPVAAEDEVLFADPPGPELVEALAATARSARTDAAAAAEEARAACTDATTAWQQTAALAERVARRGQLLLQLAALDAVADRHADDVRRLDLARRAAQVRRPLQQLDDAVLAEQQSAAALRTALGTALDHSSGSDPGTDLGAETVDVRLDALASALAGLQAARADVDELAAGRDRAAALTVEIARARAARASAESEHAQAGALLAEAERQLDDHAAAAAGAEACERALGRAQQVHAAARQLVQASADLARCHDRRREAHDAELDARAHWLDVRERRVAGMAAELAAGLEPGRPCGVCGSTDHPHPARAAAGQVDRPAEQAAQARHETAANGLAAADRTVAEATARCAALRSASEGTSVQDAEAAVQLAREALEQALASAEVVATAREAREVGQQAVRKALAGQSEADGQLTRASAALTALEPRVAELAATLHRVLVGTGGLGGLGGHVDHVDHVDLDAREEHVRAEVVALKALQRARSAAEQATGRRADVAAELVAALAEVDLTSADHARSALLPAAEVTALAERVTRVERERADLAALLAAPELAGLDDARLGDVARLRAAAEQAEDQLREAERRLGVVSGAEESLRRLAHQVRDHDDVHRDLRGRHAHVDELSRCVDGTGGGNALRMRLSAFVLAARLEEVAAAASERLLVMSEGRYALVHTDELAKGGARSGLGLQVVDAWTGVSRETSTLSGGESFLASLALALGLADVVHAESGGSAIETLFVDEGFGTLDDDTLELVMGVLDGLREGGRAVGVVSHVADLRSRISARVEVRKRRGGSSVHQSGAGWADALVG